MGFQCRQFYIKDDQCAMKVSTDSLLLGSYAPVSGVRNVLDMGTGCGLLAIMLAQRAPLATVDAFDADPAAAAQATDNVRHCPWCERISIFTSCVTQWQPQQPYDLILCNPPYFANHLRSADAARMLARQGSVTPQQWLACVVRSLQTTGKFYWVLPVSQAAQWQSLAEAAGLNLCAELKIQTTPTKPEKLLIQGWQLLPCSKVHQESLVIHGPLGGYSEDFRSLTGEFYLAGHNT